MKINLNDPRITAFALGELKGDDAIEIARAVQSDARIREAVDDVRNTSFLLMESLSGGEASMLTSAQRRAIRSASPVITKSESADESVWKKPLLIGVSVAAALSFVLYIADDRPVIHDSNPTAEADVTAGWDWSQVDSQDLTAPAQWGVNEAISENQILASTHAVAAAMRDDTEAYRKEVEARVRRGELKLKAPQVESQENDWMHVNRALRLDVPMASGAASWPWLRRYLDEKKSLPPRHLVRVEEMVNHFQYQTPDMLTSDELTGAMEICNTPWNPKTALLAVHLAARPDAKLARDQPAIILNAECVRRVRLLGYAQMQAGSQIRPSVVDAHHISKSRGNYVFYELELTDFSDSQETLATLVFNEDAKLQKNHVERWQDVSSDMRFASMVAATGLILGEYPSLGGLNGSSLQEIVRLVETQDEATLTAERRDAIALIRQVISIAQESSAGKEVD